jgi:hypothetical protein
VGAEPQRYEVLGTTKATLFNVTTGVKDGATCSYDEGPPESPGSVFSLRFSMFTGDGDIVPGTYDGTTTDYSGNSHNNMNISLRYGPAVPSPLTGKGWECHHGNDQATDDMSFTVDSLRPLGDEYGFWNVHGHGHAVCPALPNSEGTIRVDFELKN